MSGSLTKKHIVYSTVPGTCFFNVTFQNFKMSRNRETLKLCQGPPFFALFRNHPDLKPTQPHPKGFTPPYMTNCTRYNTALGAIFRADILQFEGGTDNENDGFRNIDLVEIFTKISSKIISYMLRSAFALYRSSRKQALKLVRGYELHTAMCMRYCMPPRCHVHLRVLRDAFSSASAARDIIILL